LKNLWLIYIKYVLFIYKLIDLLIEINLFLINLSIISYFIINQLIDMNNSWIMISIVSIYDLIPIESTKSFKVTNN